MSVTSCLLQHFSAKSPIAAYRADMAADVAELVADGMDTEAAWLQVADAKLADLKAERTRIEQSVADAYEKTAAGEMTSQRKGEWRPSAAEVLKAVTDVTPYGKPYTNTEGQRQKNRILKALEGLGLKAREAQSVLDKAMTTEAQRRMPTMRFILNSDVRDAADALGFIRAADAPAKRDEYPLGKSDREDRFFGTRVRVLPELKGDEAWTGTIQMTLNGGRLFSVKRDDSEAGSIRIGGWRRDPVRRARCLLHRRLPRSR